MFSERQAKQSPLGSATPTTKNNRLFLLPMKITLAIIDQSANQDYIPKHNKDIKSINEKFGWESVILPRVYGNQI